MENIVYLFPVMGVVALIFVMWRSSWVSKQEVGTEKMAKIAEHISKGAMAFLKAEYKVLIIFVIAVAIILAFKGSIEEDSHPFVALSFVVGAFCSALAGFLGMKVATKANVRTTNAARTSIGKALEVAFIGGSVMGLVIETSGGMDCFQPVLRGAIYTGT